MRTLMAVAIVVAGVGFLSMGQGWLVDGVLAVYVGVVLVGVGALALLGANVFRGGPLDKRNG